MNLSYKTTLGSAIALAISSGVAMAGTDAVPSGVSQTTLATALPIALTTPSSPTVTNITSTAGAADLVLGSEGSVVVVANSDSSWVNEGFAVVNGTGTANSYVTTLSSSSLGTTITNATGATLTVGNAASNPSAGDSSTASNTISLSSNGNTITATNGGSNTILGTTNINTTGNASTAIGGTGTGTVTISSGANNIVASNAGVTISSPNAEASVANGSAVVAVSNQTSTLANATGTVNAGLYVTGTSSGASTNSAALLVTNGVGTTHGVTVDETHTQVAGALTVTGTTTTNGINNSGAGITNAGVVSGVTAGTLSSTSTQAVNGSQLYTTNQNLSAESTRAQQAEAALGTQIANETTRATSMEKHLDSKINASTAMAAALSGVSFLPNTRFNLSANVATYSGAQAAAVQGAYLVTPHVAVNGGVAFNFGGNSASSSSTIGRVGVTFGW